MEIVRALLTVLFISWLVVFAAYAMWAVVVAVGDRLHHHRHGSTGG